MLTNESGEKQVAKDVDENLIEDSKNEEDEEVGEKGEFSPTSDQEFQQTGVKNRKCFQRYFGPMGEGSLRGGMFSLIIMTIGSSALTVPQRFEKMTLLVGVLDVIFAGAAAFWTFNLLIIAGLKHNIWDYSKLVEKLYGRTLGFILDITVIIYVFGVITLYQVICKSLKYKLITYSLYSV